MALLLAGLIMFGGSVVQGAIGFALGMIAVPLLVEAGYSLSTAVALTTLSIGIQVMFGAWRLRAEIPWRDVKPAAIARFVTVALGVALLVSAENLDTSRVKLLVGVGLLVGVALRLLAGRLARLEWHPLASLAAFSLSGLLQGLVAMGGPPLVLWMTTRDFTARQARAFTLTLFLLNAPVQVALLFFMSRTLSPEAIALAIILSPLIYAGTWIGLRLGDRFSKTMLNRAALAMLAVIALKAILSA